MNKHTPGPWKTLNPGISSIYCTIQGANGGRVCAIGENSHENHHFNARLIAAAPDLLAACQRAVMAGGPFDDSHSAYWTLNADDMAAIRAAIARATGE